MEIRQGIVSLRKRPLSVANFFAGQTTSIEEFFIVDLCSPHESISPALLYKSLLTWTYSFVCGVSPQIKWCLDKMNYSGVDRICRPSLRALLALHVPGQEIYMYYSTLLFFINLIFEKKTQKQPVFISKLCTWYRVFSTNHYFHCSAYTGFGFQYLDCVVGDFGFNRTKHTLYLRISLR